MKSYLLRLGQRINNLYLSVFWYFKRFFYKLWGGFMEKHEEFLSIGKNTLDKWPLLKKYFDRSTDDEIANYIIKAIKIIDEKNNITIFVLTGDCWILLDGTYYDELLTLLDGACQTLQISDASELLTNYLNALGVFSNNAGKLIRKNKL